MRRTTCRRGGAITLEFILVLPVILVLFLAGIQFGTLVLIDHAVSHAATVGAREAGKGASLAEVVSVVEAVLGPHCITIGPDATVILEDPSVAMPVQSQGTLPCDEPSTPTISSGFVRVTVCVDVTAQPFIHILCPFGIDLTGRCLRISSAVAKEI